MHQHSKHQTKGSSIWKREAEKEDEGEREIIWKWNNYLQTTFSANTSNDTIILYIFSLISILFNKTHKRDLKYSEFGGTKLS